MDTVQTGTYRVAVDMRLPDADRDGYRAEFEGPASALADQLGAAGLPVAAVVPVLRVLLDVEAGSEGEAVLAAREAVGPVTDGWLVVDGAMHIEPQAQRPG